MDSGNGLVCTTVPRTRRRVNLARHLVLPTSLAHRNCEATRAEDYVGQGVLVSSSNPATRSEGDLAPNSWTGVESICPEGTTGLSLGF
jgi:hypothetical protein